MKLPYTWLIELSGVDWSAEELGDRLTLCGTACEYIEPADTFMDKVVVGEITVINPVPKADKIRLATVNLGDRTLDVVCGAPNIEVGQKVPVATLGAKLAGGIEIKRAKIRGIESEAMICSERELGLSEDHSGIMVLESSAIPGTPLAKQLDLDGEFQLTFELTPNRPDSMSAIGVARDIAGLTGNPVKRPSADFKEIDTPASDYISIAIDDPDACPRYAARVIRNLKIGPSPWWMQKVLLLSGIRPISNIVDISNYVMLETGHPLHAFDYDRFGSKEVVVRRGKEKEKFTTLDGQKHELTPDVLMITNGKEAVAAGGVMGGLSSEVEDDTVNVLLEAAYFDPSVIRKSRRQLGFVTESSQRFEKGADPNNVSYALDRAAFLLQELCGGEVLKGIVDCYPNTMTPKTISFRSKRCNDLLGTALKPARMKEIFENLEFGVTGDDAVFEVTVPTFRPDIEREVDLIEEVARIDSIENIPDSIVNIGPLYTPQHYEDKFRSDAKKVLTSAGFDEIMSHGLADSRFAKLLYPDRSQLKISNPVSEELNIMRNCLTQTMLHVFSHNIKQRSVDLCMFEIGKYFLPPDEKDNWVEKNNLTIAVTGKTPHTWREKPRPYDFYDISGAIDSLKDHFGWGMIEYKPVSVSFLVPDISFEVTLNGKAAGWIGQLKPSVAKKFDIKQDLFISELDFELLLEMSGNLKMFEPLPVYPSAPRDLAFVVDETVKSGDIVSTVIKAAGELAESVDIFDLYTGKQIASGKKSIALSINYRSREGSLESSQVDERQKVVMETLKNKFNAEIRDK